MDHCINSPCMVAGRGTARDTDPHRAHRGAAVIRLDPHSLNFSSAIPPIIPPTACRPATPSSPGSRRVGRPPGPRQLPSAPGWRAWYAVSACACYTAAAVCTTGLVRLGCQAHRRRSRHRRRGTGETACYNSPSLCTMRTRRRSRPDRLARRARYPRVVGGGRGRPLASKGASCKAQPDPRPNTNERPAQSSGPRIWGRIF